MKRWPSASRSEPLGGSGGMLSQENFESESFKSLKMQVEVLQMQCFCEHFCRLKSVGEGTLFIGGRGGGLDWGFKGEGHH